MAETRRTRESVEGQLLPEPQERSSLPLLEAAAHAAGVPGALSLARDLRRAGYFSKTLLGQWELVAELLAERLAPAADPVGTALRLARHPEPRVRFHAPGTISRLLAAQPREALRVLQGLAADPDPRVGEAMTAFGVRPNAEALGPEAVAALLPWSADAAAAVRRAAVEGTRPRGVWVRRLAWAVEAPARLVPLLERLRNDTELVVANAVGNSLNDISKDHPEFALDIAGQWLAQRRPGPWTAHSVRKGLRTLVKEGEPRALRLLGFRPLQVEARARLRNGTQAAPNSALHFELRLRNLGGSAAAHLVYEIETPGRLAGRPRRKRFHWGSLQLPARDTLAVRVRERIFDTRAAPLLDGPCRAGFFLNGQPVAEVRFELRRS
ncbi:MAG: hypothetical protein EYC70_12000 [Planctomycetota bacterium]|nr:MAG: hypothetical protein EYC70_12000 [Planctomycetota bacterium]